MGDFDQFCSLTVQFQKIIQWQLLVWIYLDFFTVSIWRHFRILNMVFLSMPLYFLVVATGHFQRQKMHGIIFSCISMCFKGCWTGQFLSMVWNTFCMYYICCAEYIILRTCTWWLSRLVLQLKMDNIVSKRAQNVVIFAYTTSSIERTVREINVLVMNMKGVYFYLLAFLWMIWS